MQFLGQLFAAGLACAGLASAYHPPTGSAPVGNPFSAPGLDQVVPAGQEFIITWEPTTTGSISLLLLKGPANNLKFVSEIAQSVPNTGNFYWTPSNDLAPTGNSGYGIQLIDDATGQYQYTTQFGISNANYNPGGAMSSASSTGPAPSSSSATAPTSGSTTKVYPVSTTAATTSASAETTTMVTVVYPTTNSTSSAPASSSAVVSSYPTSSSGNSSTSSPASSSPSASPTTAQTNGASGLATSFAGLVVAAGVAVLAL